MDKLLRMAMAEKGLNGKQLALLSGVSEKSVSLARNGGGSLKSIVKMFDAMGFKLKYVSKQWGGKVNNAELVKALEQAKRDGDQGRVYEIEQILSARS